MIDGTRAHEHVVGETLRSSANAGWRSLHLAYYRDPPLIERVDYPPNSDQHIALIVDGVCQVESHNNGRWRGATYTPGDMGMTAPGRPTRLRWRSAGPVDSLHLHLPGRIIGAAREEVRRVGSKVVMFPDMLSTRDPVLEATLHALHAAIQSGADELYAGTAAHWLAMHLLYRHGKVQPSRALPAWAIPLARADEYLRARLGEALTLDDIAAHAGCNVFQLIRMAKRGWGETPLARVRRLRMEHAHRLLQSGEQSVIDVALECGYGNPSHFATAFRRHFQYSPTQVQGGAKSKKG